MGAVVGRVRCFLLCTEIAPLVDWQLPSQF